MASHRKTLRLGRATAMPDNNTVGNLIARLRAAAGLTQTEVSRATGLSVGTISRLERDRFTPVAANLAAIGLEVGATPDQLEKFGQDAAADLLRALLAKRGRPASALPVVPGLEAANPAHTSVYRAVLGLMDLGYKVTFSQPAPGHLRLDAEAVERDEPAGTVTAGSFGQTARSR